MAKKRAAKRRANPVLNPTDRKSLAAAKRLSKEFHGKAAVVELSPKERAAPPRFAVLLGSLEDLSYRVPKGSQRAGGAAFLHKAGDRGPFQRASKNKPLLLANPHNGRPFLAQGRSPMKLTRHGLSG